MLLSTLADMCQVALDDSGGAIWSQQTVQDWVLEAIRDYSNHCQRIALEYLPLTPYSYIFNPPLACLDIVSASREAREAGDPIYLTRYNHKDPRFWEEDDYYDWVPSLDRFSPGILYLSKPAGSSEFLELISKSLYYVYEYAGADPVILVPDQDLPITVHYVVWRALTERLMHVITTNVPDGNESTNPDHWGNRLGAMNDAVAAARKTYDTALAAAVQARAGIHPD
jgi:hypothetical protein